MALQRRDDSEDLETFYIWVSPNEQAAEVPDKQGSRFPPSVKATQPLAMVKKNEGLKKSMADVQPMQTCFCHDGKTVMPWWVRLDEGTLKFRKPYKM